VVIRVYTASKITTAPFWRDLSKKWPHVIFHARWLKHNEIGTLDLQEYAGRFWTEDQQDVKCADAVLVYAGVGEHLRGALVEAGMAIAFGVPVIVVGQHADYGTWQYHPGVERVADFDAAGELLKHMDEMLGLGQTGHL
jgi:hypothetical protein